MKIYENPLEDWKKNANPIEMLIQFQEDRRTKNHGEPPKATKPQIKIHCKAWTTNIHQKPST